MNFLTQKAYAKINLSLDILGKRADGYHEIETIMTSLSVCDLLTFQKTDTEGVQFICEGNPDIPSDDTNLVCKAARLFFERVHLSPCVSITLEKNIPSQAGMGGGSSDAAATLLALNTLYETELTTDDLCPLATKLGADVPFFLYGNTALCKGIGEMVTPIKNVPACTVWIAKGKEGVSTPLAYQKLDTMESLSHPNTKAMLEAIETGDVEKICQYSENVFDSVSENEEICEIRNLFQSMGAKCVTLCGSGAAVFGIFDDNPQKEQQAERLFAEKGYQFIKCEIGYQ